MARKNMAFPVRPGLPAPAELPAFTDVLRSRGLTLERRRLTTLQVNVGRLCNMACHHCHVDAGPKRPERMAREVAERVMTCWTPRPPSRPSTSRAARPS